MSDLSLLSGVKRKSDFGAVRSAFDPSATLGLISFCGRLCCISHSPPGRKMLGYRYCTRRGPYWEHTYSITWSARACIVIGKVMPTAIAVLRLMASSNFVGCSTGRSLGFAPFKILST
jgi:hypothetical protein